MWIPWQCCFALKLNSVPKKGMAEAEIKYKTKAENKEKT